MLTLRYGLVRICFAKLFIRKLVNVGIGLTFLLHGKKVTKGSDISASAYTKFDFSKSNIVSRRPPWNSHLLAVLINERRGGFISIRRYARGSSNDPRAVILVY